MKTLIIGLTFLIATSFTTYSPNAITDPQYSVTLLSDGSQANASGHYEWVWDVFNPVPGNGRDGETLQDLSHWALILGSCVAQSDIVGAAYSTDNGMTWHSISANIAVDPSQNCYTQPVMKFNYGLNDTDHVQFKLIVNRAFNSGAMPAVFKSGRVMPCYTTSVMGINCDTPGTRE